MLIGSFRLLHDLHAGVDNVNARPTGHRRDQIAACAAVRSARAALSRCRWSSSARSCRSSALAFSRPVR
jgi:hypothetical protein